MEEKKERERDVERILQCVDRYDGEYLLCLLEEKKKRVHKKKRKGRVGSGWIVVA